MRFRRIGANCPAPALTMPIGTGIPRILVSGSPDWCDAPKLVMQLAPSLLLALANRLATSLGLVLLAVASADAADKQVSYNRDIRPLLSDRCFLCHGPDEASRQADLRLDNRESAIEGAIVPGDWSRSELIDRITSDDPDYQMPPPDSQKRPFTPTQVALVKRWIDQGAEYQPHWAFVPPTRPQLPATRLKAWQTNAIDRFVLAKLDEQGWQPAAKADRRTLLRRAALDLTGLPPSRDQLEAFLQDETPRAWSNALDRLLASPAYGEHRTRYWLDAARYADTNGYQYDFQRDQWVWRDWVINAFNTNQPFDQFTIEQLAGDLLPNATPQQRLATGFNRNHPITVEGGIIDEEYRVEYVLDRTTTAGAVWLGMTTGCARCHDHKYDPLSQKEFFQFSAYFNQVPERGMNGFDPRERIPSPLGQAERQAIEQRVASTRRTFRQAMRQWNPDLEAMGNRFLAILDEGWLVAKPSSVRSQGGATSEILPDNSVRITGKNPAKDVYEIELPTPSGPIHGIRLTALPDKSTSTGGPGRSSNGNFVLSEITVEVSSKLQPENFQTVTLSSAQADYSQAGYNISRAIDGKIDNSGWAVNGDPKQLQEPINAHFVADNATIATGSGKLRVKLHFQGNYANHQFGRFELALVTAAELPAALPVAIVLKTAKAKRTAAEQLAVERLAVSQYGPDDVKQSLRQYSAALEQEQVALAAVPETMIMRDVQKPRGAYVLDRGEYDKRGEHVQPGTPAALPPLPEQYPANRLGFAKWLTMPNNPLTSRVTVNRFWIELFGIGLVDTPEDFGLQSSLPSHPELLDWLAVEFVESGWDIKQLLKTIMMSQTYQQDSSITPDSFARDPLNRFLARGPRLRLDAETIRDVSLSVSGLLNSKVGGPSVFPYHPQGLWLEVNNRPGFSSSYKQDAGDKLYRRSVYTFWKRTVPPPSMAVFDAPTREYCQVRRSRTNTPLQAFVLLHDPQFIEAARALAQRMLVEGGKTPEEQIRFGFESAVGRQPTEQELRLLRQTYAERLAVYSESPQKAKRLLSVGDSPRDTNLPVVKHAAMTSVARLLMNLSEFITKG